VQSLHPLAQIAGRIIDLAGNHPHRESLQRKSQSG
jgi:hypothetical protein